jgi:putative ABC transport system permease protein
MRPGTIFYLYRVRLRARLVQELLAVAGIAVGVALLFASQVANTSLAGSVSQLTNGLVGQARLQMVARAPSGFDQRLLVDVEALPGVQAAAPVLQRSISVVGPRGVRSVDLIGLDPRFVRLKGEVLAHVGTIQISGQTGLSLPAPVARQIGAGPLQPIGIQVGDRSVKTVASAILQASDVGPLIGSQVAIAQLGVAQALTGMRGRVNRILVQPRIGRDREVEQALRRISGGRLNVLPANFEAAVFRQAEGPTAQSTEIFSAISALVGFLFAFNAMLLTVPQRRNLIADLRLDGYAPLEIVEVMMFDVLVLGAAGVLVGLGLGDLLSNSLLRAEPGYLSLAFPVGSEHIVSWQSIAIAVTGGLLAAVIGVMIPVREDIYGTGHTARRAKRGAGRGSAMVLVSGLVCVALTTLLLLQGITSVGNAVLAFVSLTLALLLIMPTAFAGVISLIDRIQRPILGVAPRIALIELLSNTTRPRSLAIAATGAIAVYGSVAIEGAHGNLRTGLSRAAADLSLGTDIWVSPAGSATTLATTPFANSYAGLLRRLPDVSRVDVFRGGFLDVGSQRILVLGPPPASMQLLPADQVSSGDPSLARRRLQSGGWIAISQSLADAQRLHVGDWFSLPSPSPGRYRVAAIITNLGWSPGAIVLSSDEYAHAWDSQQLSAYQVSLRPGASVGAATNEVRSALSKTALVVQSAAQHEQNDIAAQRQGLARLTQIAALVLVAAALAMAAAMAAMIWQRRGRLAGMKVDGYAPGELWRALMWETGLLLGAGCSIGAIFGLYGQLVLSHALVSVTDFPVVFSIAIPVAIVSLTIVGTIALLMVALPGYFVAQVKPALQD